MERLTNCAPSRRSNCRTIWLAADWETLLVCAAWEKLRNRATSQNTFRDSNCMALILSSAFLISRPRYIIISYNAGSGTQTDSAALNRLSDRELEESATML